MPMMRSSWSAWATMARYRGSKMCSGRKTLGNRTTFGSGKRGMEGGSKLMNRLGLAIHVIHQDVLAERVRRREVCLSTADRGHPSDERDEIGIPRQHECIDHDARLLARVHLRERFGDDERVEPEGVLVDLAIRAGERRRLAVGDHHDLPHVFLLAFEDPPR